MIFILWLAAVCGDSIAIGVVATLLYVEDRAYRLREEWRLLRAPYVTVADGGPVDDEPTGRHDDRLTPGNRHQRRAEILRTETAELQIVARAEVNA